MKNKEITGEDQGSVVNHYPGANTTQSCQLKVTIYIQNIKMKNASSLSFTLCKLGFADVWCSDGGFPHH